jgi:hypothetical protein
MANISAKKIQFPSIRLKDTDQKGNCNQTDGQAAAKQNSPILFGLIKRKKNMALI